MNELFKNYTYYLADGVEACAALIIAVAAVQAVYRGMRLFFVRPPEPEARKTDVRLQLGRWLSLALEFELAATLRKTMTLLDWHQIGMFAAIYAIRFMIKQAFRCAQQE